MVKLLLKNGANIHATDPYTGNAPLVLARIFKLPKIEAYIKSVIDSAKYASFSSSASPHGEAQFDVCAGCKKSLAKDGKGNTCSGCMKAKYCTRECQLGHWKSHRPSCKQAQEEAKQQQQEQQQR